MKYRYLFYFLYFALQIFFNQASGECTRIERYEDKKDGTFLDKRTDLIWQKCVIGQSYNGYICEGKSEKYEWKDSLRIAHENRFLGKTDWRLPTKKEAEFLLGKNCGDRELSDPFHLNEYDIWFWTSSTDAKALRNVGAYHFSRYGVFPVGLDDSNNRIRLVRGGDNSEFINILKKIPTLGRRSIEQRLKNNEQNQQATHAKKSGNFKLWPNTPHRQAGNASVWDASCDSGGSAFVIIQDSNTDIYMFSGPGDIGSEVGIGVESALRRACGGN